VHLQFTPINYARKNFFLPWGHTCTHCTHCTSWLRLCRSATSRSALRSSSIVFCHGRCTLCSAPPDFRPALSVFRSAHMLWILHPILTLCRVTYLFQWEGVCWPSLFGPSLCVSWWKIKRTNFRVYSVQTRNKYCVILGRCIIIIIIIIIINHTSGAPAALSTPPHRCTGNWVTDMGLW